MAPPEDTGTFSAIARPRPRRRSWRTRVVNGALVSGTLATLPLAGATARPDQRVEVTTLAEAVSAIREADGQPEVAAALAELRSGHAVGEVTAAAVADVEAPKAQAPTPIAEAAGVELVTPSMETVLVGFHEAALPGTEEMTTLAPLTADHTSRPVKRSETPEVLQVAPSIALPTRDRPQAPTSAIDIAIPEGEDVLAPVSGTVVVASPYTLYGEHQDTRIEIVPHDAPDTRVIMIHVNDVKVEVGDEVVAGETVLAGTATAFPFESQIDRFSEQVSGSAHPHVHVEIKRMG